jgi:hypothetical protein
MEDNILKLNDAAQKIFVIFVMITLTINVVGCSKESGSSRKPTLSPWSNEITMEDVVTLSQENFRSWLRNQPIEKNI